MLGAHGSTLSVVRALGRTGIDVHVLGDASAVVRFSRYCHEFVDVGGGGDVQARWLEWLEHGPSGAVLFTCHDEGLELIAHNRASLMERGYRPLEADDDVILAMLDKQRTYELAAAAGVPAPRTWEIGSWSDLHVAESEADFPCALKPRHSHLFARRFGEKLLFVSSAEELRDAYRRCSEAGLEMIVTEIVPGPDHQHFSYYTYLDERGAPMFELTKRKLRQYPIGQGLGSYHVTDWNPEVAELGLRFLRHVGLRGIANPEFKRDARTGELKLIEVNHRFTAINELVQAAGIDLAQLAYSRVAGSDPPSLNGYRRGAHIWFPTHDARAFLEYRRRGELTLLQWLRSLAHRQRPVLFSLDDPLPGLANLPMRGWRRLRPKRRARGGGAAPPDG
jgi:D-aspartate ligase